MIYPWRHPFHGKIVSDWLDNTNKFLVLQGYFVANCHQSAPIKMSFQQPHSLAYAVLINWVAQSNGTTIRSYKTLRLSTQDHWHLKVPHFV